MLADIQVAASTWPETASVTVDLRQVDVANPALTDEVLLHPGRALRIANKALNEIEVAYEPRPRLAIRLRNAPESCRAAVRDVRSKDLGRLIVVDAVIRKATAVKALFAEAVYECKVCTTRSHVLQDEAHMQEPVFCEVCEKPRQGAWRLLEEESRMLNVQRVQLEELTETMEVPAQPQRIQGYLTNDDVINHEKLLNEVGSRVRVTGFVTLLPPRKTQGKPVERDFCLHLFDVAPLDESHTRIKLKPEDVEAIQAAANRPTHVADLVASLAPHLAGLEVEKEAMWLAMVGGVEKALEGHHARGDIHMLLCGDPSTGKSQLLKAAQSIVPRSVFAGSRSSAAGLTAAVVRDDFDGQWTLEPGAMPLADRGICFVDELDKMDEEDQNAMHQALEQQETTINMAGINATLKTRCGVIAACNPKDGRFSPYEPLLHQIRLTPPLFSRFDVILTLTEKVDPGRDLEKARTIARAHRVGQLHANGQGPRSRAATVATPYELAFLRKFVTYVKANVHPILTQEAEDHITAFYLDLRRPGAQEVSITTRQYEGLIRLCEASARLRLSGTIAMEDARRAVAVYREFLQRVGLDHETGRLNIDLIFSGTTKAQADRYKLIVQYVRGVAKPGATMQMIVDAMKAIGSTEEQTRKDVVHLYEQGSLYRPGTRDHYQVLS